MPLSDLFSNLKGGANSGHHGHSGVKGKRGGSAPSGGYNYNGILIRGKPTFGDFITLHKWEKSQVNTHGIPVYLSENELPPVPSGHTRLAHGALIRNIESITRTGLKSGKEAGMREQIDVILGVQGSKSHFGNVSVVFDLPSNGKDWRSVNSEWVEVSRTIKPSEIKGLVLGKIAANPQDLDEIVPAYRERYGDEIKW